MRLFVLDNALQRSGGHHRDEDFALSTHARRIGIDVRFLIHAKAEPEIVAEMDARPVFSHSPYGSNVGGWRQHLGFQRQFGHAFAAECRLGIPPDIGAEDVVFLPNATHKELGGLVMWLRDMPRRRRPRIVAHLTVPFFLDAARRRLGAAAPAYALAGRRLAWLLGRDRLVLASGSAVMSKALRRLCGHEVDVFPVPKSYLDARDLPPRVTRTPGMPATIVFLGGMVRRPEKGVDVLPSIVELVRARRADTRFILHANPLSHRPETAQSLRRLAAMRDLTLIETVMSRDDYARTLTMADIVVLPYPPNHYWARTSGVFCEAGAYGRVTVVPEGTWLADMLDEGLGVGVTFASPDAETVANALVHAIDDLPALADRAAMASGRVRRHHSVEAFLDAMLKRLRS